LLIRRITLTALVALALAAVWIFTPLRSYLTVDAMAAAGAQVRDSPLALLWVVAVFVLASLVFFPITALLVATALVFDGPIGLVYGMVASTAAAWVTYLMGRLLRRWHVRWLQGPRFTRLCLQLQRRGFTTILLARVLPVGNFSLFNIAAGAMELPLGPYMLGSALGLLPRVLALTFFAGSLGRALRHPTPSSVAILVLIVVVSATPLIWLRRRARRAAAADAATSARAP
jgi:phospholipase D1/2